MENLIRIALTLLRGAALLTAFGGRGGTRHLGGMAFAALWLWPTLRRNCQWHGQVLQRFSTDSKEVWLTIDDGPNPNSTPDLLEILQRFEAKASFFVIGKNVEANRALSRKILNDGHTLENHSQTHPAAWWWALPGWQIRKEIEACQNSIFSATGKRARFFRPPVGMCGPGVHPAAKANTLQVVGWSAAGGDGCARPPSKVLDSLFTQIRPGAILVVHEGERPRHRAIVLTRLLEHLSSEGYRCVIPGERALF
jgi:peptidoglycan/xylan/chitin deacetylase (PgdA/CDA1 family)